MIEPKKTIALEGEKKLVKTKYGEEIENLRTKYEKNNPNFGAIIKEHQWVLNKYYTIKRIEGYKGVERAKLMTEIENNY